jgi:hypothetical protein
MSECKTSLLDWSGAMAQVFVPTLERQGEHEHAKQRLQLWGVQDNALLLT